MLRHARSFTYFDGGNGVSRQFSSSTRYHFLMPLAGSNDAGEDYKLYLNPLLSSSVESCMPLSIASFSR